MGRDYSEENQMTDTREQPQESKQVFVNMFERDIIVIGTKEFEETLTISKKNIPEMLERLESIGCASQTNTLTLTQSLAQHYAERSQATGKPVQVLVLRDLAALHRKRVAREESRVFRENEFERL